MIKDISEKIEKIETLCEKNEENLQLQEKALNNKIFGLYSEE